MDQFVLLNYLQQRDKKLSDVAVNARLSGNTKGLEDMRQERAILAALAELVRGSPLPRFQEGTVGKPKPIALPEGIAESPASVALAEGEGPEFDPEPDLAALRAADASNRAAAALAAQDPALAPSPPAQFIASRNVGGRPRKDGSPAQPRST